MDKTLKLHAAEVGLHRLLDTHPELVEAAWKRARHYAEQLPPMSMSDEPAFVFKASSDARSE